MAHRVNRWLSECLETQHPTEFFGLDGYRMLQKGHKKGVKSRRSCTFFFTVFGLEMRAAIQYGQTLLGDRHHCQR